MTELQRGPTGPVERQSIKRSRWALSVPFGVVATVGAGILLDTVVGSWQPNPGWQQNIILGAILLVGSLATGVVAGARTLREWAQAAMLTAAGFVVLGIVIAVYVMGTEPPR
jgi:peptidoglycan/LPS O-acetylase OafA/YrhL